jgi:hypothetical protein
MKKKHQKRLDKMVAWMSERKKEKLLALMAEKAMSLNGHEDIRIVGPGGETIGLLTPIDGKGNDA